VETVFKKKFDYDDHESYVEELRSQSQILVLLYDMDELTGIALIGRKRMKQLSFLQLNHLCANKEHEGSGSRLIAELRHFGSRFRYTSILVNSMPSSFEFYSKMKFMKCNFKEYLGGTYCYFKRSKETI
jgi:hypothetical protein